MRILKMAEVSSGSGEDVYSSTDSGSEDEGAAANLPSTSRGTRSPPRDEPLDLSSGIDSDVPLARLRDRVRSPPREDVPVPPRNWVWRNNPDFYPRKYACVNRATANFSHVAADTATPASIFWEEFFTDEIIDLMVTETNRFQRQHPLRDGALGHQKPWTDVTQHELKAMISLAILMGVNSRPEMRQHWSTDPLLSSPTFREIMSRDRFLDILSQLHFRDNEAMRPDETDRLYKLRPVLDHLANKYRSVYTPGQNVTVDESLMKFKGRLKFKQYCPMKRSRFGIKVYRMCDVGDCAGYTIEFHIYSGQDRDPNVPASQRVVLDLTARLNGLGHTLALDRGFSCPELFLELHNNRFNVIGTVQANRRNMPKELANVRLAAGEIRSRSTELMLAMVWQDKRQVRLLTTMHTDVKNPTGKRDRNGNVITKPAAVLDYNRWKIGVDLSDQFATSHQCARKTVKWYKKLFFFFVDCTLVNAFRLYKLVAGDATGRRSNFTDFRLSVVRESLEECRPHLPRTVVNRDQPDGPARLTERHFPSIHARRNCHVCYRRGIRMNTRYRCIQCNMSLCLPCFQIYYTIENY